MKDNTKNYVSNFGEDYAKSLPSLADSMIKTLQFFDCKRIYGVGGDFAANLIRAFENDFKVLPSSNEMHASFSACGQAEVAGIGFCITTYTVGSLPCMSAAALAKSEGLPVVFISGAPGENETGELAIHHTVTSFSSWNVEYDATLKSFRGLGLRAERLQGARNFGQPSLASEQFFKLVAHAFINREPVFIEIPRDLIFCKTQDIEMPLSKDFIIKDMVNLKGANFIATEINNKLKVAKHPLVYIGENIKLNPILAKKILLFCEQFQIPFVSSWFGKGVLDEFHPLSLGSYNGVFSSRHTRRYIENQVDYIFEIATSIFQLDTNLAFNTGTHLISSFKNKTLLKGTAVHQKDIIKVLDCLTNANILAFKFKKEPEGIVPILGDAPVDFNNLTKILNDIQRETTQPFIYFPEIGNSYFTSYSLKTRQSSLGRSWVCNSWYGAMGTSLPYARATAEILKGKKANDAVVVITGDGGFHFQLNELIHFMKGSLSVIIIYMRNNIFHLGKNSDAAIYSCNDVNFDVIKLIEAYGGNAKKCTTVSEFSNCFKAWTAENNGIKLIEVPALPNDDRQGHEIKLLNLYISAKNGIPKAMEQWEAVSAI